ncbi:MAG: hypothetical protein ABW223_00210 [Rariglobus sp.]
MSLSSLKRFLPSPPPRHVVLLPDSLFFVRSVPVIEGSTAVDVSSQVELAIETLAPFPVAQLYYGCHWFPGVQHALIYAAYRKRFTSDEVETWASAEAVMPSFVAFLTREKAPKPATVLIVSGVGSLTGMYFSDASGVPTQVRVEPVSAEATEAERATARAALLNAFPEKLYETDVTAEPQFDVESPQGEFVFKAGAIETHFNATEIGLLDVRDKDELHARRRAHKRDVILWRTFIGSLAVIALSGLLELALVGSSVWQKQRLAQEAQQKPVVDSIMTSQALATRIDELSTKRLLPFEMMALVNSARPRTIQFMRTATNGLYTLEVEAQTSVPNDIDVFRSALNRMPSREKVEVLDQRSRDGVSTFRLVVVFKADAFQTATQKEDSVAPPLPEAAAGAPAVQPTPPAQPETPSAPVPAPEGDAGVRPPVISPASPTPTPAEVPAPVNPAADVKVAPVPEITQP